MRNVQSSPSTTALEFGETARPSVPSASRRLSKTDGSCLYDAAPIKLPQNQISFCNAGVFSCPHWTSPSRGLYLCLWPTLPLCLQEDLTPSWTAWTGSKAAWAWEAHNHTTRDVDRFSFPSVSTQQEMSVNITSCRRCEEWECAGPPRPLWTLLVQATHFDTTSSDQKPSTGHVTAQPVKRIHKESSQASQLTSPFN